MILFQACMFYNAHIIIPHPANQSQLYGITYRYIPNALELTFFFELNELCEDCSNR